MVFAAADLGLANGAGSHDVDDNAESHVDEIVVGVSEECRCLVSAGPYWAAGSDGETNFGTKRLPACAPRRIVEGRQILLHRTA